MYERKKDRESEKDRERARENEQKFYKIQSFK